MLSHVMALDMPHAHNISISIHVDSEIMIEYKGHYECSVYGQNYGHLRMTQPCMSLAQVHNCIG